MFRATRQLEGVGQQPFIDSYHMVEMEVEAVEWELNSPAVTFRRLTRTGLSRRHSGVWIASSATSDQMMGIDPIHPLAELHDTCPSGCEIFYSEEYADFLGLQEEQARMLLIGLTNSGYVDLDLATRYCEVKPRAERHIKARKGSSTTMYSPLFQPAQLHDKCLAQPQQFEVGMKGIGRFGVSEAQDVKIVPDGGELALGKNRSLSSMASSKRGSLNWQARALSLTTTRSSWKCGKQNRCASRRKSMANTMHTATRPCVGWRAPSKR